jgi:citrate lyase beta subunit
MSTSPWVAYSGYIFIGLGVVMGGLIAWVVMLQVRFSRLYRQYVRLMTGTDGTSLEQLLNQHMDAVKQAVEKALALEIKTRQMDRTLKHSMQWMGIVRFNPFRDTGGAQSFALAIVDGHGDGVVLSSLHSRENIRVYAKALNKWESEHTLTDEEKQAIARAYRQQV